MFRGAICIKHKNFLFSNWKYWFQFKYSYVCVCINLDWYMHVCTYIRLKIARIWTKISCLRFLHAKQKYTRKPNRGGKYCRFCMNLITRVGFFSENFVWCIYTEIVLIFSFPVKFFLPLSFSPNCVLFIKFKLISLLLGNTI